MENVQQLINEIHNSISQKTASRKDEVRVMRAMLNDMNYKVAEYDKGEMIKIKGYKFEILCHIPEYKEKY